MSALARQGARLGQAAGLTSHRLTTHHQTLSTSHPGGCRAAPELRQQAGIGAGGVAVERHHAQQVLQHLQALAAQAGGMAQVGRGGWEGEHVCACAVTGSAGAAQQPPLNATQRHSPLQPRLRLRQQAHQRGQPALLTQQQQGRRVASHHAAAGAAGGGGGKGSVVVREGCFPSGV